MAFCHTVRGERFVFPELRDLLAKANEPKSGDQLAGVAAHSDRERAAAKFALADVPLAVIVDQPVIGPDADDVSRLILDSLDRHAFAPLASKTVGEFRELLGSARDECHLAPFGRELPAEFPPDAARRAQHQRESLQGYGHGGSSQKVRV